MNITLQDFLVQGEIIEQLIRSIEKKEMVHAFIISGEEGIGKKTLAKAISKTLMCSAPNRKPCGVCDHCLRVEDDNHPDIIYLAPGKPLSPAVKADRVTIPVDDIREIIRICSTYSFEGGCRIVIIDHAETMTVQAENCLLKTLEDPPRDTLFFLLTSKPELLLTTIRSRCRLIGLHPWPDQFMIQFLQSRGVPEDKITDIVFFAHGSIGMAEKLVSDGDYWQLRQTTLDQVFNCDKRTQLIQFAASMKDRKNEIDSLLDMTESLLSLLLYSKQISSDATFSLVFQNPWPEIAQSRDITVFCELFDTIRECRKMRQSSVNATGIIEKLLYAFMEEKEKWQKS